MDSQRAIAFGTREGYVFRPIAIARSDTLTRCLGRSHNYGNSRVQMSAVIDSRSRQISLYSASFVYDATPAIGSKGSSRSSATRLVGAQCILTGSALAVFIAIVF